VVRRFRFGEAESEDLVGVTTGLAWTEVGGELLTIEAVDAAGQGAGDRHRQARRRHEGSRYQAAESYVKSRSYAFGIRPSVFEKRDIHVHVPEGARPRTAPPPASAW